VRGIEHGLVGAVRVENGSWRRISVGRAHYCFFINDPNDSDFVEETLFFGLDGRIGGGRTSSLSIEIGGLRWIFEECACGHVLFEWRFFGEHGFAAAVLGWAVEGFGAVGGFVAVEVEMFGETTAANVAFEFEGSFEVEVDGANVVFDAGAFDEDFVAEWAFI
jgi:hypothetical protein